MTSVGARIAAHIAVNVGRRASVACGPWPPASPRRSPSPSRSRRRPVSWSAVPGTPRRRSTRGRHRSRAARSGCSPCSSRRRPCRCSSNGADPLYDGSPNGDAGQMNTSPSTRSGCSAPRTVIGPEDGRDPHEDGRRDAGGVHHRDEVRGPLARDVDHRIARPVGPAVPAVVPRDHPVASGEVGDLGLPGPRVDDLPRRHEHDRRVACAVDLVGDPAAVALDEAGRVRVAGARLLARPRPSSVVTSCRLRGAVDGRVSSSSLPPRRAVRAPRCRAGARPPCAAPSGSAAWTRSRPGGSAPPRRGTASP